MCRALAQLVASCALVVSLLLIAGAAGCASTGDDNPGSIDASSNPGADSGGGQCSLCSDTDTCCGGFCVDTNSNRFNCGACGTSCDLPLADSCSLGVCSCDFGPACQPGETCCGGSGCQDLMNDAANCGECGNACGPDEICQAGMCVCAATEAVCEDATTCCDSGCIDTMSDDDNCGACDNSCADNQACTGGECLCAYECPDTPVPGCCGDACVDLCTDTTNCGECGKTCAEGVECVLGLCDGDVGFPNFACIQF